MARDRQLRMAWIWPVFVVGLAIMVRGDPHRWLLVTGFAILAAFRIAAGAALRFRWEARHRPG
jgi:hypothetical protein